jgi:protein-serine/threonine kinase
MLAGYLPFDDDPANPEGDNINLLYKYIVSTPLTFPEYVTPHARDLLKRILVPDPRKRADLFEVARHSWLADYSHVVGFITSTSPTANDAQQASVYSNSKPCLSDYVNVSNIVTEDTFEQQPPLARSASVREPGKPHTAPTPAHGGLTAKREQINSPPSEKPKTTRDNKRRTVQVEYVAPQSQTVRGETSPPSGSAAAGSSHPRVRKEEPTEVPPTDGYSSSIGTTQGRSAVPVAVARPKQEAQRSVSDYTAFGTAPTSSGARPSTGGALGAGTRLPSRGNSYGQPSAATVAQTNVEGRFSQPKGKQYTISAPYAHPDMAGDMNETMGQPSTQRGHSIQLGPSGAHGKGSHRRSNTVTETIGRMTSMFSGRQPSYSQDPKESMTSQNSYANYPEEKRQKNYPPTSMAGPMSNDAIAAPRKSTESSRRSFGFARRNTSTSGETTGKPSRRFSLLPSSLSKTFSSQRDSLPARSTYSERRDSSARPRASSKGGMAFGRGESRSPSQSTTGTGSLRPGFYDGQHDSSSRIRNTHAVAGPSSAPPGQTQFDYPTAAPIGDEKFPNPRDPHPSMQGRPVRHQTDDSEFEDAQQYNHNPPYPQGMGGEDDHQQQRKGVLQKSRKFQDAYEGDGGNKGSSSYGLFQTHGQAKDWRSRWSVIDVREKKKVRNPI